jgi:DNA polymerase-1
LASARIVRTDCYITNVIKEQPPTTSKKTNDISTFIDLDKKPVYETPEYLHYKQQLYNELETTDVNIIVAFGNVPLYALTGIYPPSITKRRGSVYESLLPSKRKVLASIHPAACIHQGREGGMYLWRYYILHDLHKAKRESEYRELHQPNYKIITAPSLQDATFFLGVIKASGNPVAFDIEVVNLEVSCISFCTRVGEEYIAISIPFISHGREYFNIEDEALVWRLIADILEDSNIKKIGQNAIFDGQFLFRKYGIVVKHVEDTMIAQAILVPDFPKGLDFINSVYTEIPYYKDEGKKYIKIGGDETSFWEYNAKDSIVCSIAFPRLIKDLEIKDNIGTYDYQKMLIEPLMYMSERGIRVDVDGLKRESEKADARVKELTKMLNTIAGKEVNWNSSRQVMEYLYDEKGYKEYKKRTTGKRTSDEDALKRLSRSGSSEASILLECRKLSKLKSTYLDVTLDSDHRLRCSYNPVGAADSGRLSSSTTIWETGMNLQNDPPEFKKYMLFDEGYIGYNIDLSQAENRIVAYIAPEHRMIEAFESGADVHKQTAGLILNKPADKVSNKDGSCPFCVDPTICGHTERFWGKRSNHAFNYGLGYRKFAYDLEIPENIGKTVRMAYHTAYPGVQVMWNWIQEELRRNRTLTNLLGRKRMFMAQWGEELFKEAYSYTPQSTVADIINRRGLIYIYYNQDIFHHVELLNQIHDSIVFQIPRSVPLTAHIEAVKNIVASLEQPLVWRQRSFTIPASISVGLTNMKDMQEVGTIDGLTKFLEAL